MASKVISIRVDDKTDALLERMIKDGVAKDKKEALEIYHYLKKKKEIENIEREDKGERESRGEEKEQNNEIGERGEYKIEKRVSKPDEAIANILLKEWEELKSNRNDIFTQLGMAYIQEKMGYAQQLEKEVNRLKSELESVKKRMDMMDIIKEHSGDIIEIAKSLLLKGKGVSMGNNEGVESEGKLPEPE